jgi:hypothetical protein
MKTFNKTSRSIIATLLAGGALLAAGSAFAQERVIVENGPGPVVYGQPHMMPVDVSINIGWHGIVTTTAIATGLMTTGCVIIRTTTIRITTTTTSPAAPALLMRE